MADQTNSERPESTDEWSASAGPEGILKEDIEYEVSNPNIARAVPHALPETEFTGTGTYPDIVEGSDSARTGTSWGLPPLEGEPEVETSAGMRTEGTGEGEAAPNRNTGSGSASRDDLRDTGSWSTMDSSDSAGSPSGNS